MRMQIEYVIVIALVIMAVGVAATFPKLEVGAVVGYNETSGFCQCPCIDRMACEKDYFNDSCKVVSWCG